MKVNDGQSGGFTEVHVLVDISQKFSEAQETIVNARVFWQRRAVVQVEHLNPKSPELHPTGKLRTDIRVPTTTWPLLASMRAQSKNTEIIANFIWLPKIRNETTEWKIRIKKIWDVWVPLYANWILVLQRTRRNIVIVCVCAEIPKAKFEVILAG